MLVLKRLSDAERDGDRIYSVIRSIGSASDGREKSLTAPAVRGQTRAVQRAYDSLEFSPSSVELVEAHGTGTVVGDRTELETLRTVFQSEGAQTAKLRFGLRQVADRTYQGDRGTGGSYQGCFGAAPSRLAAHFG